jgi:hypothetical protein
VNSPLDVSPGSPGLRFPAVLPPYPESMSHTATCQLEPNHMHELLTCTDVPETACEPRGGRSASSEKRRWLKYGVRHSESSSVPWRLVGSGCWPLQSQ